MELIQISEQRHIGVGRCRDIGLTYSKFGAVLINCQAAPIVVRMRSLSSCDYFLAWFSHS